MRKKKKNPPAGAADSGIEAAFRRAVERYQAGDAATAEGILDNIERARPGIPEVLHLLGLIALKSKRYTLAALHLRRAVEAAPGRAELHALLGAAFRKTGAVKDAVAALRTAVALDPNAADARYNLGNALRDAGEPEAAAEQFRNAARLQPDFADAHYNLGMVLRDLKRPAEAVASLHQAARLAPADIDAASNLGNALREAGKPQDAMVVYTEALAADPNHAGIHLNLGNTLAELGRHAEAVGHLERAVALKPDFTEAARALASTLLTLDRTDAARAILQDALARDSDQAETHFILGTALLGAGDTIAACAAFEAAVRIAPDHNRAITNLVLGLVDLGRADDALAVIDRAIARNAEAADMHFLRAVLLLRASDFERGWPEYEWRLKCADQPPQDFGLPRWSGEDIEGKAILIYAEQGSGDAIQFARFMPLVVERGARIVVACPEEMMPLLATMPAVAAAGLPDAATKPDFQVPLMSLPWIMGIPPAPIPNQVPYLYPPADSPVRLEAPAGDLKVGLAWAGNPRHSQDRNRSTGLDEMRPILGVPGCRFFSLQVGDRRRDIAENDLADAVVDLGGGFRNFADTAAAIDHLDLVIAVDTAVAHLAGALGKPVWTLLQKIPDWRWLMDREDTPWYPTMRLFRQPAPGDWETPIAAVDRWLDSLASS